MVERLLHVDKAHEDKLGEITRTLGDPAKSVELVHCSTAGTKTTLLLYTRREAFGRKITIPAGIENDSSLEWWWWKNNPTTK